MEKSILKRVEKSFGLKKHGFSKKFLEIYNRLTLDISLQIRLN